MKHKAVKGNKKSLKLFTTVYGFRQPFQVLVDADFVQMAASQSMDILSRLESILQGKVKPMISQCSMEHLYARGEAGQAATVLARSLERRKCNHWEAKEAEDECIAGLVGEKNNLRYIVVTQSAPLRERLRKVPGTPLLYINHRSVLLLEAPSDASVNGKKQLESDKRHAPAEDLEAVRASTSVSITGIPSGQKQGPNRQTAEQKMLLGKRKRPSNPNPLSMLKKKRKKPVRMPGTTKETLPLRKANAPTKKVGKSTMGAVKARAAPEQPVGNATAPAPNKRSHDETTDVAIKPHKKRKRSRKSTVQVDTEA